MPSPTRFSLFRRANGKYYIAYVEDGRRRWKSTRCHSRSQALAALTEFRALIRVKPRQHTLSQFLKEFTPYAETHLTPRTTVGYLATLRKLLSFNGDAPLAAITSREIDAYIVRRRQSVQPVTVNIELRTLKAIFNVALRWGLTAHNPVAGVRQLRLADIRPAFLQPEDLQALVRGIRERWLKELVIFCVATGARRGEAINLTWDNVDLHRRLIHFESSQGYRTKGGKRRTVPISSVLYGWLARKQRDRSFYVFHRDGQRLGADYVSHLFKRYVRTLGLDERLHLHSTRHSFASLLVLNGTSLYQVQKLMGHADPRTTAGYSHLAPETMHDAVDRIQLPSD